MQTKKIISIALTAALVSSIAAVATLSASAVDVLPDEFTKADLEGHTMGVMGSFDGWGSDVAAMTDDDGDGIYLGVIEDVAAGSYEFKVRLDGAWDYSWGAYEEENDRIFNSQINCQITTETTSDIVVALDANGEDGNMWPVTFYAVGGEASKYTIVGSMTGWAGDEETAAASDIPMYETEAGKYVGIIKGVTGEQEFKVRDRSANPANIWQDSWGAYEVDNDRTYDSQTNMKATLDSNSNIIVTLDTTTVDSAATANPDSEVNVDGFDFEKDGFNYWPVSYTTVAAKTASDEESSTEESTTDESSTDESTTDESSTDESSTDEPDQPSIEENYETQISDYIFFDNSETQWENVYAYWWNTDFTKTVDLEDHLWGSVVIDPETGEEIQDFDGKKVPGAGGGFPGELMTQIPDTDIWQVRVPFGATKIIFSNGMKDDEISKDVITDEQVQALADGDTSVAALLAAGVGIQTVDLEFDSTANAGQVYKIDTTTAPTSARGNWKNRKWSYGAGAWEAYEGEYSSELLNAAPARSEDPSEEPEESSEEPGEPSGTDVPGNGTSTPGGTNTPNDTNPSGGNNNGGSSTGDGAVVATGDTAVPAVFAVIAIAALGVAIVAFKKKERA